MKFKLRKSQDFGLFKDDILRLLHGDVNSCQMVPTTFHFTFHICQFEGIGIEIIVRPYFL
jgi:hypothetical protein